MDHHNKVEMKEWISLGELIKECGKEMKVQLEDPLEGYICCVQDALRNKMDPFEEKFAKGAVYLFESINKSEE
jgi:hypothetical protein